MIGQANACLSLQKKTFNTEDMAKILILSFPPKITFVQNCNMSIFIFYDWYSCFTCCFPNTMIYHTRLRMSEKYGRYAMYCIYLYFIIVCSI